jgi:CheY-like chemotaxis protein
MLLQGRGGAEGYAARHLLVVDDAMCSRKLLMCIFRMEGFLCEEAYDGQDALQKYANMCAQGTPPSAILMDYEMPVLNGPSATRQLREQGCSCFIIGVTGSTVPEDKGFFISCGADVVFTKPLKADDIMTLMGIST